MTLNQVQSITKRVVIISTYNHRTTIVLKYQVAYISSIISDYTRPNHLTRIYTALMNIDTYSITIHVSITYITTNTTVASCTISTQLYNQ